MSKDKRLDKRLELALASVRSVLASAGYSSGGGTEDSEHWSKGVHHVYVSYSTSSRMHDVSVYLAVGHRLLVMKKSPGRLVKLLPKAEAETAEWLSSIKASWSAPGYTGRLEIKKKGEREKEVL